jgi:hypothetical protein
LTYFVAFLGMVLLYYESPERASSSFIPVSEEDSLDSIIFKLFAGDRARKAPKSNFGLIIYLSVSFGPLTSLIEVIILSLSVPETSSLLNKL